MNTAAIGTATTVSNGNFATPNSNASNTASGSENRKPAGISCWSWIPSSEKNGTRSWKWLRSSDGQKTW